MNARFASSVNIGSLSKLAKAAEEICWNPGSVYETLPPCAELRMWRTSGVPAEPGWRRKMLFLMTLPLRFPSGHADPLS